MRKHPFSEWGARNIARNPPRRKTTAIYIFQTNNNVCEADAYCLLCYAPFFGYAPFLHVFFADLVRDLLFEG